MVSSDSFVSVVAPLYNDADILVSFVESVVGVLEVSYANWELVLVDDGSTDETVDCVTKLLKASWDSKVQRPLTDLQWAALGDVAKVLVRIEDDLEQEEISID